MDINQQHKVQCFNCHADITSTGSQEEGTGPTCQQCLNAHSSQITNLQTDNQMLYQMLAALQGDLDSQVDLYRRQGEPGRTLQQLEGQLAYLEQEQKVLRHQDHKITSQIVALQSQFQQSNDKLDNESRLLCAQQVILSNYIKLKSMLEWQVKQLELKRVELERVSVLSELYSIHFDNEMAYINQEAVGYHNCNILVQMLCHVAEMSGYKEFNVDFARNCIVGKQRLSIETKSPEATLPWLRCLSAQVLLITEYMREQATVQPSEKFSLPFKMTIIQGEVTIDGMPLREGPSYLPFLKLLTHELKFMMSYAFMRLRKS